MRRFYGVNARSLGRFDVVYARSLGYDLQGRRRLIDFDLGTLLSAHWRFGHGGLNDKLLLADVLIAFRRDAVRLDLALLLLRRNVTGLLFLGWDVRGLRQLCWMNTLLRLGSFGLFTLGYWLLGLFLHHVINLLGVFLRQTATWSQFLFNLQIQLSDQILQLTVLSFHILVHLFVFLFYPLVIFFHLLFKFVYNILEFS